MIKKLSNACNKMVMRYLPDSLLFALILTAIVFILGLLVNHDTPLGMIVHWGSGFWSFLAFSMEMVLVVVFANALAEAPVFRKFLKRIACIPKTAKGAIAFCICVTGIATMLQWALGLVVGAVLSKEIARNVKVDYRLLVASAYCCFVLHLPTNSMIMKVASTAPETLAKETAGVITDYIPMSLTAYTIPTMGALLVIFIGLMLILSNLHPDKEHTFLLDASIIAAEDAKELEERRELAEKIANRKNLSPAERLETSKLISIITGIVGWIYIVYYLIKVNHSVSIDLMNMMLLFAGILLHGTPASYIDAIKKSIKSGSGIILQFPFYAGIMGMLTGIGPEGTSLAAVISNAAVAISNKTTYPLLTFLSAGLVNLAVPSAGGQWGVQAPIMMPGAQTLGTSIPLTVTALAWGDTWTNLIQPFWALPVLGIAGLKIRDIMGYCVIACIFSGLVIAASLLIWAAFF